MGEAGSISAPGSPSGMTSLLSLSGKGPFSGLAGDTGREPGIGGSRVLADEGCVA